MQVKRMPYRGNMSFGRGVNTLTGEVLGLALQCDAPVATAGVDGQESIVDVQMINSHEQLMKSMGLSVEASGRYGLFSAEGKFGLAEKSSYNSQSSFIVASCRVQNAFLQVNHANLLPEAAQMLKDNRPDVFKTTYGDSFVRGLLTGGEFFAVVQITSTDEETQKSLAASLHAECQGLVASGSFSMAFNQESSSKKSKTEVAINFYQRAGQDEQLAFTKNADEVLARLKAFPSIARAHPIGYEAEVANYNTLALPMPNFVEIENREFALQDCARLRLKYLTIRNDIEFARTNPVFFDNLPTDQTLQEMQNKYEMAINFLMRHASRIAGGTMEPKIFVPAEYDANLAELPLVNLTRKAATAYVSVPDLRGLSVTAAKQNLQQIGLVADSNAIAVDKNSAQPLDVVTSQDPLPGTELPAGGRVRINYNYIAHQRFNWHISDVAHDKPDFLKRLRNT